MFVIPAKAGIHVCHSRESGNPGPFRHSRESGNPAPYADVPGFCASATLDDIRKHGYVLTPGRYVGAAEVEDDGEPFEEKMTRLTAELAEQMKESGRLDKVIAANLKELGFG